MRLTIQNWHKLSPALTGSGWDYIDTDEYEERYDVWLWDIREGRRVRFFLMRNSRWSNGEQRFQTGADFRGTDGWVSVEFLRDPRNLVAQIRNTL